MGFFPFRFDGIALTQEQKDREEAQKKRSSRNTILGALIGVAVAVGLMALAANFSPSADEKTFSTGVFSITLTEDFQESDMEGYYAYYESNDVVVLVQPESMQILGDMSLQEYATLLRDVNGYKMELQEKGDIVWFSYTKTIDQMQFYYMVFCMEGDTAFWTVNFATPIGNRDKFEQKMIQWAQSVQITQGS
jgi:hypothetical protein